RYAANAGLIGLLSLAAAGSSLGQVRTQAPAGNEVVQYCAPQDESTDAPKFYCRSGSDRARSDAHTCYRRRDAAIFDLRRREFIPLLGAAAVYPSPADIRERIDAAVRPRRVCTT